MSRTYEETREHCIHELSIITTVQKVGVDLNLDFGVEESMKNNIGMYCPTQVIHPEATRHSKLDTENTKISLKHNNITCYPCGLKWNNIDFIMYCYDIEYYDAIKKLMLLHDEVFEADKDYEASPEAKAKSFMKRYLKVCNENLMKGYEIIASGKNCTSPFDMKKVEAAQYLLNRGISQKIASKLGWGIGGFKTPVSEDEKRAAIASNVFAYPKDKNKNYIYEVGKNRILIPNKNGEELPGVTCRSINPDDKLRFLNIGNVNNLINLDKAKMHKKIVIFEGAVNMASYMELTNMDNTSSLQGCSTFNPEFFKELVSMMAAYSIEIELILCFDSDNAGKALTREAGEMLMQEGFLVTVISMPTKVVDDKIKKVDLNELYVENGKEKACEIWDKLYTDRLPFVAYMIKEELFENDCSKLDNSLVKRFQQARIIEKYLKWDMNPLEREAVAAFLLKKGYMFGTEILDYTKIKYLHKIDKNKNQDVLVLFLGKVDSYLTEVMDEEKKQYAIYDVKVMSSYEIPCKAVFIVTDNIHIAKALFISRHFEAENIPVKVSIANEMISSKIQLHSLLRKADRTAKVVDDLRNS